MHLARWILSHVICSAIPGSRYYDQPNFQVKTWVQNFLQGQPADTWSSRGSNPSVSGHGDRPWTLHCLSKQKKMKTTIQWKSYYTYHQRPGYRNASFWVKYISWPLIYLMVSTLPYSIISLCKIYWTLQNCHFCTLKNGQLLAISCVNSYTNARKRGELLNK